MELWGAASNVLAAEVGYGMSDESRHDVHRELHRNLLADSPARFAYTRRAFGLLPPLNHPRILDMGCGSGGPTRELALLSQGQVIGLDIERSDLVRLQGKLTATELEGRIQVVAGSMFRLPFSEESFDILWAEGVLHIIGFAKGLRTWRRLLKPAGFLVTHEMCWLRPDPPQAIRNRWHGVFPGIGSVGDYLARVTACGYKEMGHFALPEDAWWIAYYRPLAERIQQLREQYAGDSTAQKVLDQEQREVELYWQHRAWYGSAFLVMQRSALTA